MQTEVCRAETGDAGDFSFPDTSPVLTPRQLHPAPRCLPWFLFLAPKRISYNSDQSRVGIPSHEVVKTPAVGSMLKNAYLQGACT